MIMIMMAGTCSGVPMSDEVDHETVKWFGQEPGPTRQALDVMLGDPEQLDGRERVVAELARMSADLVDSAANAQDARIWLAASNRLLILIDKRREKSAGFQDELFGALGEEPE